MSIEFINALTENQAKFGVELSDAALERLANYYKLVQEHNPILHLVGPSTPAEFATRHILESLTMLQFLPTDATFADVGAGAGLPSIPCLLVREGLTAILIDSKEKKTNFLEMAVASLGIGDRATVVNKQFQEVETGQFDYVACRALDKFTERLPRLLKWSMRRHLLIFGNEQMGDALRAAGLAVTPKLMPLSEQRYLFVAMR
jgi:16S rRNA (guanine(527)-N(7))-methyltransferase RsmG